MVPRTLADRMDSIAKVTNVALVCFTSRRTIADMTNYGQTWLFECVEHELLLLKYILTDIVDGAA